VSKRSINKSSKKSIVQVTRDEKLIALIDLAAKNAKPEIDRLEEARALSLARAHEIVICS